MAFVESVDAIDEEVAAAEQEKKDQFDPEQVEVSF